MNVLNALLPFVAPAPMPPHAAPAPPPMMPPPAPSMLPALAPHFAPAPNPLPPGTHFQPPPMSIGTCGDVILGDVAANAIILGACAIGALFAVYCAFWLKRIKIEEAKDERAHLNGSHTAEVLQSIFEITKAISEGANAFLWAEYRYMGVFIALFFGVIVIVLGVAGDGTHKWTIALGSGCSFLLGAFTSIISGFIGMRIAVYANGRTSLMASEGYAPAFVTALRGGIVMGFGLTVVGLIMLYLGIIIYFAYFSNAYGDDDTVPFSDDRQEMITDLFSSIAAYGLGGSSIAMFGRVGGGIFTKAADVGADLVGKVEKNIPEDDPRNPGVIADCIGDNVGDIAGMGSDLFGSFAEASCAALVIAASNKCMAQSWTALMYPLLISAVGIIVCIITSFVATDFAPAKCKEEIEPTLKRQLLLSCVIATVVMFPITWICLPSEFSMVFMNGYVQTVQNWWCFFAVASGLWAGLGTGYITEYFTSNAHKPVIEVADACTTGAATNIIYGLALGYKSVIVPTFLLATCIYVSYNVASVFGIALGALGILSTMSLGLTVDAYGPISDNAGGIAEMAGMEESVRECTDALDAAGNTTAAIGKGYAIGSAAMVGLALYGAFLTRVYDAKEGVPAQVNIIDPRTYFGLIIGAMIPYWFSALTMKSVGTAAMAMVREIQHQFRTIPGLMEGTAKPNYRNCVKIATDASLREMLLPGALVVLSPVVFGIFFGPETLSGLLPGALVSGVQMAISASNTGGAWDNAKKYVEAGKMGKERGKGSDVHKAAVIGDTVGDPLKDTSGPALNIVVKLMAIISVVFAPILANNGDAPLRGLLFDQWLSSWNTLDSPLTPASPPMIPHPPHNVTLW